MFFGYGLSPDNIIELFDIKNSNYLRVRIWLHF